MNKPVISIIAVLGKNTHALGKDGKLLWHIPDDLKRVKKLTTGHPIIMGRKTYESIGKPLPNRTNIVVTRNENFEAPGCVVVSSLEEALAHAKEVEKEEIFIFGGGELYKQALPITDKLYLTLVDDDKEGDTFFPDYSDFKKITHEESHEHDGLTYTWVDLVRDK